MFSIVFQKLALFLNLKKLIFSKIISFFAFFLSSVFISMYGFSQTFWLNWMILCNFFSILIHYSMPQFFMCTTYSFWLCKLDTSFLTFSIFVISGMCSTSVFTSIMIMAFVFTIIIIISVFMFEVFLVSATFFFIKTWLILFLLMVSFDSFES